MTKQTFQTTSLEFCSRCLHNEINGWLGEKWQELSQETKNQILQELRTIKLKSGLCLVCNNTFIADKTTEKILAVLEENKAQKEIVQEFKRYFVCS